MRIVLTEDVVGVGDIGETVNVRPGFARNYLVPRGLAIESSSSNAKQLAHRMLQIEAKKRRLKKDTEEVAQRIRDLALSFDVRVASGGKVFGSITAKDIAAKLSEAGFVLDRKRVLLAEPLKKVGTHFVRVKLHAEVEALVKVSVNALEASAAEEAAETREVKARVEAAAAAETSDDSEE